MTKSVTGHANDNDDDSSDINDENEVPSAQIQQDSPKRFQSSGPDDPNKVKNSGQINDETKNKADKGKRNIKIIENTNANDLVIDKHYLEKFNAFKKVSRFAIKNYNEKKNEKLVSFSAKPITTNELMGKLDTLINKMGGVIDSVAKAADTVTLMANKTNSILEDRTARLNVPENHQGTESSGPMTTNETMNFNNNESTFNEQNKVFISNDNKNESNRVQPPPLHLGASALISNMIREEIGKQNLESNRVSPNLNQQNSNTLKVEWVNKDISGTKRLQTDSEYEV